MANKGLVPLSSRQIAMIVGNIKKVVLSKNSRNLSKQAYNFVMQASGFIAHYNLYGFQDAYEDTNELATAILNNKSANQWDNFSPRDRDYNYMMAKKLCYNSICTMLLEHGFKATRSQSFFGW